MATEEVGIRLSLQGRREAAAGLADVKGELDQVADAGHDVETAGKAAERGLERASSRRFARGFSAIGRGALGVTRTLGRGLVSATRAGAVGLGILAAAAAATGVKAIGLAGDARETASAFNTVFGPAAKGVQRELDQITRRFGTYNPALQDAARQFGVFGKAAGIARKDLPAFSTSLVKAGGDLSSFYNTDPGETFQALQSGLSGEAEPLRKFGIFISDAALKAEAANMGLTGVLTDQQKVMIRQKIIMKSLGDAQGDLARTAGGYANQQRGATDRVKTFLTMLGGPLTTAATGAFRGLNSIAIKGTKMLQKRLPDLEKKAGKASKTFARWGRDMAKDLPGSIKRVTDGWDRLTKRIGDLKSSGGSDELQLLGDNLRELAPALKDLATALPNDLLTVTNVVTGFLAKHTDKLTKAMPYLVLGYIALKASQLAHNVVLAASVPLKIAEFATNRALVKSNRDLIASRVGVTAATVTETGAVAANTGAQSAGIVARARAGISMVAHKVALGATAVATGVVTAAQWLWNAALTANPIGLVVAGIALLVGGLILAYKKSETFRGIVDGLWNNVLKPFGKWVGGVLVGYFRLLATAYLTMARFGIKAFGWLLTAAFKAFDGILAAAEAGLGWIPGLGDKIKGAREAFNRFGTAAVDKLKGVEAALGRAQEKVNDLGRDRKATITIGVEYNYSGLASPTRGRDDEIAGRRAGGGPVSRGRSYVVGEHRPELFVPKVDGMILPRIPDLGDVDLSDPSIGMTVGPGAGGNTVVQLVVDGKVLAETVVDKLKTKQAYR